MVKKENKQGKLVLLVAMTFVIVAVVTIVLVILRERMMPRNIGKQSAGVVNENSEESMAEQYVAELGWSKMIGGSLTKIDLGENVIEVDIDPLGEQKKYKVNISGNTKVIQAKEVQNLTECDQSDGFEEDCLGVAEISYSEASLKDLQQGQLVSVSFAKRVDLETESFLSAVEIIILPN